MRRVYLDNQLAEYPRSDGKLRLKAEESARSALGASSQDRFIFTASGKEAMEKVFLATYLDWVRETGRTHFLTYTSITSSALRARMEKLGCLVKPLPVNEMGQVTRKILEGELRARTALVSTPWADPFTGVIHPILDLGELCREREILLHVDGSAAFGKFFFRFQDFPVDFLTLDGAAMQASHGGLLARGDKFSSSLELEAESSRSIEFSLDGIMQQIDHITTETARLRNKFEERVLAELFDATVLYAESERVPHISAIIFEGVHKEALLFSLERKGVYAFPLPEGLSGISFSLSQGTTEEEIDYACEMVVSAVKKLRSFSVVL